jgi:hypothetical protein
VVHKIINKRLGLIRVFEGRLVSTDKEKLNLLQQKIDQIQLSLSKASEDLRSISAQLKMLTTGQTAAAPIPPQPAATAAPQVTEKKRSLDDIRLSFPEELESRLSFEEKGEYIVIKPTQFLGTNFAKVASAVRGMGGDYISAGKDSHFRVPKKKA